MPIREIKSKITGETLHMVYSPNFNGRTNIVDENNLLQIAEINLQSGQTFKAHSHLPTERRTVGTEECWIILWGWVKAQYYDLDGTFLEEASLGQGEMTITLKGGHNYVALSNARVYEIKNGPYMGVEKDKIFLR